MEKDFKNVFQMEIAESNTRNEFARLLRLECMDKVTYFVEVLYKFTHVYKSWEFNNYSSALKIFNGCIA